MKGCCLILMALFLMTAAAGAGEADVEAVKVSAAGEDRYRFEVTIRHADEGWDHYADRFEIVDGKGHVLGTRVLYHPHVDEQPFTRSLEGVSLPPDVGTVTVRAHDSRHAVERPAPVNTTFYLERHPWPLLKITPCTKWSILLRWSSKRRLSKMC